MRIIFAGTPHFAANALEELVKMHEVIAVLTQPDRCSGRGMLLTASPVKQLAQRLGIKVLQPDTLKTEAIQKELKALKSDIIIVAAYGLILPKAVLQMPDRGCLNIHASLLPRWRGAAPIQRAILAGDTETGITIMQMDEGLDTGSMLLKRNCAVTAHDTSQTLHDKLADIGARAIIEALDLLEKNLLRPERQDEKLSTYAAKLSKAEARLDWNKSAPDLERAVRGYFPFPVATTTIGQTPIKILRSNVETDQNSSEPPGTVVSINKSKIVVACGQGTLAIEQLQKPGGTVQTVAQFIQGSSIKVGDRFITL